MNYLENTQIPLVSVIILNHNGKKFLNNCISSVLDSNYPRFEIIVVDNNSGDGSIGAMQKQFEMSDITILKLTKNYGFSKGNNLGAQLASGSYLFFLNNDTVIDRGCIKSLILLMESEPRIGAAQAKLLSIDGRSIDSVGCFFDRFGFVSEKGFGESNRDQYTQIEKILYAKGAAIVVRRDLWEKLGGFDPLFFAYFEETDFCWRVWLSGYSVVYNPDAIVNHIGKATLKKYSHLLIFQEARNRLVMLIKNYETKNLFKYFPITTLAYVFNALNYLKRKDLTSALLIMKSVFWCFHNLGRVWKKRLEVQFCFRSIPDFFIIQSLFDKSIIPLKNALNHYCK